MVFDFEPSGINSSCLRIERRSAHCVLSPAGLWNGLLRLNHMAPAAASEDPFVIFRAVDVGFDVSRFTGRGRAAALDASPAMLDLLVERELATPQEAAQLRDFGPVPRTAGTPDAELMLRAVLHGAAFTALTSGGYALRTLSDSTVFVLAQESGLPILDPAARRALERQLNGEN